MASTYPDNEPTLSASTSSASSQNRDSNMVRASVLDAALQLGFGGPNSTVANWIFNNPLDEVDESEESRIPELTPSIATSEDSHSNGHVYPYTPLGAGAPLNQFYSHNSSASAPFQHPSSISSSKHQNQTSGSASASHSMEQQSDITPSPSPMPIPFPTMAPSISAGSSLKQSPGTKLKRKVKKSESGYETDGYLSDGAMTKKGWEKTRKEIEAKAAKKAEKEAKEAKKEAKKEEKIKKSMSKKEKKDKAKSKAPISGDATDYETDAASDGAYLSEAVSISSVSSKKTKASSKSKAENASDSGKPKKSPSFFRRKSKPTPVVPPMPTTPIPLSASASTPMPSASAFGPAPASEPASKVPLPPIAAKFATTNATPPVSASTPSPSVSSLSPNPFISSHSSPLTSPTPTSRPQTSPPATSAATPTSTPSTVRPTRDINAAADEAEDAQSSTTSSHSSEISMPPSLLTSASTSSHRKPSRVGLFKFGGSNENIKAKPNISLPLSRTFGGSPMSSRGASPMPGATTSGFTNGSGLEPRGGTKPMLEVQTQDLVGPPVSRGVSPVPSTSYVVVTPVTSTTRLPSPLAQSSTGMDPSPGTATKGNLGSLIIQHPHDYNGSQPLDSHLPSPRRPNLSPAPPPTPPPTIPLPRVPPVAPSLTAGGMRAPASPRPFLAPPPNPAPARTPSPLQRGKEAPFPTGKRDAKLGKLDGFQGRMEIPRYRGLYGFGGGLGGDGEGAGNGRQPQHVSAFSADSDEETLDPEMLSKEFQQIRRRFYEHDRERASVPVTEPDWYNDSFSGGDDSFSYQQFNSMSFSEDLEPGQDEDEDEGVRKYSDDRSLYPDDDKSGGRRTMYELEGRDSRHYDDETRISRYSATQSVYSVMDDEKSGEARERFLKRVAAMYGEGGREVPPMPPIPKMPEGIIIKGTGVGMRRRMGV